MEVVTRTQQAQGLLFDPFWNYYSEYFLFTIGWLCECEPVNTEGQLYILCIYHKQSAIYYQEISVHRNLFIIAFIIFTPSYLWFIKFRTVFKICENVSQSESSRIYVPKKIFELSSSSQVHN